MRAFRCSRRPAARRTTRSIALGGRERWRRGLPRTDAPPDDRAAPARRPTRCRSPAPLSARSRRRLAAAVAIPLVASPAAVAAGLSLVAVGTATSVVLWSPALESGGRVVAAPAPPAQVSESGDDSEGFVPPSITPVTGGAEPDAVSSEGVSSSDTPPADGAPQVVSDVPEPAAPAQAGEPRRPLPSRIQRPPTRAADRTLPRSSPPAARPVTATAAASDRTDRPAPTRHRHRPAASRSPPPGNAAAEPYSSGTRSNQGAFHATSPTSAGRVTAPSGPQPSLRTV